MLERWVVVVAVLAALAITAGCERLQAGQYARKNLLVISIDTLRADRLAAYGYARATSPVIDGLASDGIVFEHAFAPRGMTWPSLATMLTALSPTSTKVRSNGQYLAPEIPTIASILRDAGYRVGGFLGGSICHMARGTAKFHKLACGDDAYVTSRAIEFFRATNDQPVFAWLHLMAPHAPYEPEAAHDLYTKAGYAGPVGRTRFVLDAIVSNQTELSAADLEQLSGLYDGEVHSADAQVGLLLKALDELDERKDTVIVLTADHGEDLYEHNRYLYHACSIYESTLRIPLMLALPDRARAGTRYTPVVENIDLAPTVLDLLGVAAPSTFEGRSLLPRLAGDEQAGEAPFAFSEWYDLQLKKSLHTVRTAEWRYIANPEGLSPKCVPGGDYYKVAAEELYDLRQDPAERNNVAAAHPEVVRELAAIIVKRRTTAADASPLPVDPKLHEELRSFGYVE